ncbi:hypothetical protein DRO33_01765 [Candidatus Bathyarchaeota archaeon]|nr:MAG: hypothetical protein DRO33_01765 [Candidatus Bathyarchaeota archaeon]
MSRLVRDWLQQLGLYHMTTHEDREEIDRQIEARTGVYCDDAIRMGLISREEFEDIVWAVLKRKKRRRKPEILAEVV